MKIKSIVLATMIMASGFAAQSAQATVSSTAPVTLVSDTDGGFNAHFGNQFSSALTGQGFSDQFSFTVTQDFDSSTSLTSSFLNSSTVKDLSISSFNLYSYDAVTNTITTSAIGINTGGNGVNAKDSWELTSYGLTAGTYYIQVTGMVLGNGGGSYGSDLTIAPTLSAVPEPESYAMMLAGLGMLGFMARRKRATTKA